MGRKSALRSQMRRASQPSQPTKEDRAKACTKEPERINLLNVVIVVVVVLAAVVLVAAAVAFVAVVIT